MSKDKLPDVPPDAGKSWHQVVERPNELAKKVPKSGGVNPEKAFQDAEKIVQRMAAEYVDKLGVDIKTMKSYADGYRADPSQENLDKLFRLIHNMRGQGATFGFPLITEIGRNFCRYVRERPPEKTIKPALIDQHVKALQVVYEQSIKGTGDEISQEVVKALNAVVEKEMG
ncbi:MAG: Hpt domain-containing protein [Alphaproteobacteria bacterium]